MLKETFPANVLAAGTGSESSRTALSSQELHEKDLLLASSVSEEQVAGQRAAGKEENAMP